MNILSKLLRLIKVTIVTTMITIIISFIMSYMNWTVHIVDDTLQLHYMTYQMNCDVYKSCRNRMQPVFLYVTTVNKFPSPFDKDIVGFCSVLPIFGMDNKWTMFGYVAVLPPSSADFGETSGPYQYKALMYHELAHCIHGVTHDDHSWIMPERLRSNEILQQNWQDAVYSLFHNEIQ